MGLVSDALTYMAKLSEGVMVLVDPMYTSQLCSGCGEYVPKTLDVRVHICPYCGLVLDRDVNAARVILRKGIGLERPDFTPVGEVASTQLSDVGRVASVNQEAHLFRGG